MNAVSPVAVTLSLMTGATAAKTPEIAVVDVVAVEEDVDVAADAGEPVDAAVDASLEQSIPPTPPMTQV
jgi:hypothetical protein